MIGIRHIHRIYLTSNINYFGVRFDYINELIRPILSKNYRRILDRSDFSEKNIIKWIKENTLSERAKRDLIALDLLPTITSKSVVTRSILENS
jgi:hypothetical protein